MNIAVINLKDIFKILIKLSIVFVLIFVFTKLTKTIKANTNDIFNNINKKEYSLTQCIGYSVSFFNSNNSNERKISLNEEILKIGFGEFNFVKKEEKIETAEEQTKTENTNIKIGKDNIVTEAVTENNIKTNCTDTYNSVEIKNGTDYTLTQEMLTPNPNITNTKDILIFHTHTCESYMPSESYNYEMTGNYRTTDLNYTVARVGTELTNCLTEKGFNVIHDMTCHDYPAYNGSYTRSLETVTKDLQNTPAQIVIDLHRDAVGSMENYGPTVKINGNYAAQIMYVIGTDAGGLEHPDWVQNLKVAIKIQEKANEMYPRTI